jgi:hypothetical protein
MYDQKCIEKNDNQKYFSQTLAPLQDKTTSEINDYDILLIKNLSIGISQSMEIVLKRKNYS